MFKTQGGDGKRVLATQGVTTTVYVGNYFELSVSGGVTDTVKYYYAGGSRIAMRQNEGAVKWLLGDHLGSTSLVYDGSQASRQGYKAWGERRFIQGAEELPTTFRYTGQREESSIGLYYYGARWYDASLGRFVQPDTLIPDMGNSQAWDRYAYVYNNPVRFTDPSGHLTEDEIKEYLGVDSWEKVLAFFEKGGVFEGKWGMLQFLREAKMGDKIFMFSDPASANDPAKWTLIGTLAESNSQLLIKNGSSSIDIYNFAGKLSNNLMIGLGRSINGGNYLYGSINPRIKYDHLQFKNWEYIDKLDLGVDTFGIIGDVAFLFPGIGTCVWFSSEIPEFLTLGKSWDQLDMGDPSGVMTDIATALAQTWRMIPEGGWVGNVFSLSVNMLEIAP